MTDELGLGYNMCGQRYTSTTLSPCKSPATFE